MQNPFPLVLKNPNGLSTYYCYQTLGSGGFGEVWAGISDLEIPVAVKLWRPTAEPIRDFHGWLNEQGIMLQCLKHPYIITSYDQFISPEGYLVIVMERAEGSLEGLVEKFGAAPPKFVVTTGIQLTFALDHIHAMNVIHRDLTARNVLWFPSGIVKLADFGISKQLPSADDFARTLIGLRGTIPPELLSQGRSTAKSDIYQLGLVLLHLLLGKPPIASDLDFEEARKQITNGVPRQLAEKLIPTHGPLAVIISAMLRRHEEWRYQTPADVRTDLVKELQRLSILEQLQNQFQATAPNPILPPMFRSRP